MSMMSEMACLFRYICLCIWPCICICHHGLVLCRCKMRVACRWWVRWPDRGQYWPNHRLVRHCPSAKFCVHAIQMAQSTILMSAATTTLLKNHLTSIPGGDLLRDLETTPTQNWPMMGHTSQAKQLLAPLVIRAPFIFKILLNPKPQCHNRIATTISMQLKGTHTTLATNKQKCDNLCWQQCPLALC